MSTEAAEKPQIQSIPQEVEADNGVLYRLETAEEFAGDFVESVKAAQHTVILRTMQFEVNDWTAPMFEAAKTAKERGVPEVSFRYDPVARQHLRVGEDEVYGYDGRTFLHKGDKTALKAAYAKRERLIDELEVVGVATPQDRTGKDKKLLTHDHVKLAVVDNVAWLGTMNLRGIDFTMSNFMMRIEDPAIVSDLATVARFSTEEAAQNRVFSHVSQEGVGTEVLYDGAERGRSAVYNKAVEMAESLQPGDEFVLVSQWPPVKRYGMQHLMLGRLQKQLDMKAEEGAQGQYLMSPAEYHHPLRGASLALQRYVEAEYLDTPQISVENLQRQTHAKALLINRLDGSREVLFGSHNLSAWTTLKGNQELAMWTNDPDVTNQVADYIQSIRSE